MAQPPGNGPYTDFAGVEIDMRTVGDNQREFEARLLALEARALDFAGLIFRTTGAGVLDFEVTKAQGLALDSISGSDATIRWLAPRTSDKYIIVGTVNLQPNVGPSGSTWGALSLGLETFAMRLADTAGAPTSITGFFPRVFTMLAWTP